MLYSHFTVKDEFSSESIDYEFSYPVVLLLGIEPFVGQFYLRK